MLTFYFVPSFGRVNTAAGSGARGLEHRLWGSCQLDVGLRERQAGALQGGYHWSTHPHGKCYAMHGARTWLSFFLIFAFLKVPDGGNGWVMWCEEGWCCDTPVAWGCALQGLSFLHLSLPSTTGNPTCIEIAFKESYSSSHMAVVFPHLQHVTLVHTGGGGGGGARLRLFSHPSFRPSTLAHMPCIL